MFTWSHYDEKYMSCEWQIGKEHDEANYLAPLSSLIKKQIDDKA